MIVMNTVDFSAIGRKIKEIRKTAGKTQDGLAEALGVSVGYISQIERGATKVSLTMLFAIAEVLHCAPEELIRGSSSARPEYLLDELVRHMDLLTPQDRRLLLRIAELLGERE